MQGNAAALARISSDFMRIAGNDRESLFTRKCSKAWSLLD
jgi:hypothetical protein